MLRFALAGSWLFLCACKTTHPVDHVADESRIEVVKLVATIDGRVVPDAPASDAPVLARVTWGSPRSAEGEVIFFADHTECVRSPRDLGTRALATINEPDADVRAAMVRIDFKGAEVVALERGLNPDVAVPWVLVGDAGTAVATREVRGRAFARELMHANVASRVRVAAVPRGDITLVLLPEGGERVVTDELPVRVRGPRAEPLPEALATLAAGADPNVSRVRDGVVVSVTRGDERALVEVPVRLDQSELSDRDVRWIAAFQTFGTALKNGCVVR